MGNKRLKALGYALLGIFLIVTGAAANDDDLTEFERAWLEGDDASSLSEQGETVYIEHPSSTIATIHNQFILTPQSLVTGWVELRQCHSHLDEVSAAEVVYRHRELRDLRVTTSTGIAESWVEESTVQMRDIQPGARLCIQVEVRNLRSQGHRRYQLVNGPYHRRFLDGYFPLRVILEVEYPQKHLRIDTIEPDERPGLEIENAPGRLRIDAAFSGNLTTKIGFDGVADRQISDP